MAGQNVTGQGTGATAEATPLKNTLDAAAVRQWLASSGVLAEASLARGSTEAGPADLKLALGQMM